ncbi:MAG: Na+/H+ antiporter [Nocardiaceae bacterium]|nr:Na+/H+ antiporter [Nocardiaceae bacterium]
MNQLLLIFLLLLGALITVPLARKIGVPSPILMTFLGVVLALVPSVPQVSINPDMILPLVLPPLLYAAAQRTTWRQFAENWQPITLLAVAMVLMTTAAVAFAAFLVIPGMTVAAAVTLGALVAPPDPVAVTALAGRLNLPRRLVSILEGEGLLNDVTAIVIYELAIVAAVSGHFSWGDAGIDLILSALIAVAVGAGAGWLGVKLMRMLGDASLRVGLSLLLPFAVFKIADDLHGSGVLAVVVTAIFLSEAWKDADDIEGRLTNKAFWRIMETLITGIAFGLIGLELPTVFTNAQGHLGYLALWSIIIVGVVIGVRLFWLVPATSLVRRTRRRFNPDAEIPASWRETVVMWWAGMRGVASAALALAIPFTVDSGEGFPARDIIIVIAFAVIMVTLVFQGTTLPIVVKLLNVAADQDKQSRQERHLAERAYFAALDRINLLAAEGEIPAELVEPLSRRAYYMSSRLHPHFADEAQRESHQAAVVKMGQFRIGQREMMSAAREAVLSERNKLGIDPEVVDHVVHLLDIRSPR